jgi:hypothetical protein
MAQTKLVVLRSTEIQQCSNMRIAYRDLHVALETKAYCDFLEGVTAPSSATNARGFFQKLDRILVGIIVGDITHSHRIDGLVKDFDLQV